MTTHRYSDAELEEFRQLLEKKLSQSEEQLASLQEQILEITENSEDEYGSDWMDDSSINDNIEMLNDMAIRQRIYIQDLKNALIRIRNKTYGICVITGELIDPKRLRAVPTTTKSLQAKQAASTPPSRPAASAEEEDEDGGTEEKEKKTRKTSEARKVITRVIRKTPAKPPRPVNLDEDEDEENFDFPDPDFEEGQENTVSLDDDDLDIDDLDVGFEEEGEEYN